MTTQVEDQNFIKAIISSVILEDAIGWIASNMNPNDVFSQKQLEDWAKDNGYKL